MRLDILYAGLSNSLVAVWVASIARLEIEERGRRIVEGG
jgi:hypothetical protein